MVPNGVRLCINILAACTHVHMRAETDGLLVLGRQGVTLSLSLSLSTEPQFPVARCVLRRV